MITQAIKVTPNLLLPNFIFFNQIKVHYLRKHFPKNENKILKHAQVIGIKRFFNKS